MKDESLLTATQKLAVDAEVAAETIGLQTASLTKDRREGHLGIPYVKAGRRVIYRLADLKSWLEEQRKIPPFNGKQP